MERLHINDQSIIVTFRNALKTIGFERKLRKEFVKKGYVAKYNFHNIVGISSTIQDTKQIAKRLAKTDLTVLIEGESGTEKSCLQVLFIMLPSEIAALFLPLTSVLYRMI